MATAAGTDNSKAELWLEWRDRCGEFDSQALHLDENPNGFFSCKRRRNRVSGFVRLCPSEAGGTCPLVLL